MSEKNKVLNMTFNVKNDIKQLQSKIDLLTNQLEQSRSKQIMLNKEETKLKKLIMEKKEMSYNLVSIFKSESKFVKLYHVNHFRVFK